MKSTIDNKLIINISSDNNKSINTHDRNTKNNFNIQ